MNGATNKAMPEEIAAASASADDFIRIAGDPALRALWPQRVAELVDVVQAAFAREQLPPAQADRLAAVAVLSVALYIGGRQVYLPIGDRVKKAVLRRQVFNAWQAGAPVDELPQRFGLSIATVRTAINEGRDLNRIRQPT